MKQINSLLGIALCLSIVSFAPKSLITEGRSPASQEPTTTIVRVESEKQQLYVFGPLVIYKRAQRIEEVRVHYQRLQSDVETIAAQKREIESLLSQRDLALNQVKGLQNKLKKLSSEHSRTLAQLEQIKTDFEAERTELQAEMDALIASRDVSENEKREALALLENERAIARDLATDMSALRIELDESKAELADVKTQLEETRAELVEKDDELNRIKCENENALATLKDDIKKIQDERDELTSTLSSLREGYEADLARMQMQNQMMMMAMSQFSFQQMLSPQHNPYLAPSSLFDPNFQSMHMQQAQLLTQMAHMQLKPQIMNNYYGDFSFAYGSGSDFMTKNPMQNDHYSLFADTQNLNSSRMPSSVQPSLMPGYFTF